MLETLFQTLSEALGLHKGHRAWKLNARAAERMFCFREALRKGSREAQMARQKMTKEDMGKKQGKDRGKESRGGKKKMYISVKKKKKKVSVTHRWNITVCLLI